MQPYRDLRRLFGKEVVLPENASWLFRVTPYLIFALTWVAAALVPTFRTGLLFSWCGDLIAIVALLGAARFLQALVALDAGTSFGGIGASREMMIASLAEPAMIMVVFTVALAAGSSQLSTVADFMAHVGSLRVSFAMALVALVIVALAENARIPVDNPATHLELTMVHEAMLLEYSGRHLAMIEWATALKLLLYISVIGCIFVPFGLITTGGGPLAYAIAIAAYLLKVLLASLLLAVLETVDCQDARLPRAEPDRHRADARPSRHAASLRLGRPMMTQAFAFDVANMFAGLLVLVSFMMLYQDRLLPLIDALSLHALLLAFSVAWQAYVQDKPDLYVTAFIALAFKAIVIPMVLRRMVVRMDLHREIETAVGTGITMLIGIGLVALSMDLMLRVTQGANALVREDVALALAVVLLGLLMMVTRRNAISQVIGFMSLENGLILAGTGARGMPLVVEISVAFSVLIAFIVIGIFLFRIRERFDTVDLQALDNIREARR